MALYDDDGTMSLSLLLYLAATPFLNALIRSCYVVLCYVFVCMTVVFYCFQTSFMLQTKLPLGDTDKELIKGVIGMRKHTFTLSKQRA